MRPSAPHTEPSAGVRPRPRQAAHVLRQVADHPLINARRIGHSTDRAHVADDAPDLR